MRTKLRSAPAKPTKQSKPRLAKGPPSLAKKATKKNVPVDPLIEAEDREIRRLEKLLGIGKKSARRDCAKKLNKEYEEFEGIDGNFGDFLMELDDLVTAVETQKPSLAAKEGDGEVDVGEEGEEEGGLEEVEEEGEEQSKGSSAEEEQGGDEEDEDEEEQDEEDSEEVNSEGEQEQEQEEALHTYRPVQGEDIYGRIIDPASASAASTAKYVPPSKRLAAQLGEGDALLKHRMTGLMNKLSESSRDFIVKEMVALFREYSTYHCLEVLSQRLFQASLLPHSVMTGLIPLQMTVVSALHLIQGTDVGATIIEKTFAKLAEAIETYTSMTAGSSSSGGRGEEDSATYKIPHNCLLIIVYLYNFKVLHHTLVMDLLLALVSSSDSADGLFSKVDLVYRMELIELILYHAGTTLRNDDPNHMLLVAQTLQKTMKMHQEQQRGVEEEGGSKSRLVFMLELLTDLKQGKVRKIMVGFNESIKNHRKYLSTVKTVYSKQLSNTPPLRVGMIDLLQVEKRGRWWRTGAFFNNNNNNNNNADDTSVASGAVENTANPAAKTKEEAERSKSDKAVSKLSAKLHLHTPTRKLILKQLLLARDVHDAFERMVTIEQSMAAKEDREVVRVLLECCGNEPAYNSFYTELIKMLCEANRQYRMSLQYALWDVFKLLDEEKQYTHQYILNLGQLVGHLVVSFTLPLAVIRPIDMATLTQLHILFLSTLFLTIFQADIEEESYRQIFDRLSTAKDCHEVHGSVSYFIEVSSC
eukprot:gene2660-2904_t